MNTSFKKALSVLMSVLMVMALCAGSVVTAFAADLTALERQIGEARSTYDYIVEDCPDAAAALLEAIGAAEAVADDADATQDEIDAAADAIVLAIDKAAFEWWRVDYTRKADDYAKPGDSEACAALIAAAKEQLAAVIYDEALGYTDNISRFEEIMRGLRTDLEAQRDADTQPAETGDTPCPFCGEVHGNGFFEKLIALLHRFLQFFRTLFSDPSGVC